MISRPEVVDSTVSTDAKETKQTKPSTDLDTAAIKLLKNSRLTFKGSRGKFKSNPVIKTTIVTANYFNMTAASNDSALDLVVSGASEWASFAALYDEARILTVHAQYDLHRLITYGTTTNETLALFWAYDPTVSAPKSFDKVSDYSNGSMIKWSNSKPWCSRTCKPLGLVVTASDEILKGWQPTSEFASTKQGTILFSVPSPLVGTVPIYYRLVYTVEFRLRQGS